MKKRTVLTELQALLDRVDYTGPGKLDWDLQPGSALFAAEEQVCELTMTISWNHNGDDRKYHNRGQYTFRLLAGWELLEGRFQYQCQQLMRGLTETIVVGPRPLAVMEGGSR